VKDVVVLSRVTLGADVAVTSVVLDAARQAFPQATLHLAGNAKNVEIFAAEPRLRHLPVPYARTGSLRDRLNASASLASSIPEQAILLDPDSRLSQLGLIPIGNDDRYFFFESRTAGENTAASIGELTSQWCEACLGVRGRAWVAPMKGIGAGPRVCISLGTGENPDKGLGPEFESDLVRRLATRGEPVLIDKGMGGDEGQRVERAIAASGVSSGQIETWLGPFAPFAFEIARAPIYCGYDSAGQHVAAAAGTPLRCIFAGAPSDRFFDRWKPWGRNDCRVARIDNHRLWPAALDRLLGH
jgi:ADP-heptose:LPS heptosyltransferase